MESDRLEQQLLATGLNLGEALEVHSEDMSAGLVFKQTPPAGDKVERGSFVNVTISLGSKMA